MVDRDSLTTQQIANNLFNESTGKLENIDVTATASPAATTVLRSSTTGTAAIAIITAFAKKMRIKSITGHATAAVVEALTITLDSKTAAAYDTKLQEVAASWEDFFWQPDGDLFLEAGDELAIACANSGSATYGIEVIAEEVN